MLKATKAKFAMIVLVFMLGGLAPSLVRAEDANETAGVAVALTVGNALFLPIKAISASMGLISSAASLFFSGGNVELSKQILLDTTQGPYLITPDLAKAAVGDRPELDVEE
jgi:hypothetical protein